MKALVEYLVKNLVDDIDGVEITEVDKGSAVEITITVNQGDMGKIIGKQGRIAKALRSVVKAASTKVGKRVSVEISEKK